MGSYEGLLSICDNIVGAVREYTIAHESLDNIEPYTKNPDVEKWPFTREWRDTHRVLAEKFRGTSPGFEIKQSSPLFAKSTLVVVSVSPASPFAKSKEDATSAKLRPGDEIVSINGFKVKGAKAKIVTRLLRMLAGPLSSSRTPGLLVVTGPAQVHRELGPDAVVVRGRLFLCKLDHFRGRKSKG